MGDARPAVEASAGGEDAPAQGSAAACERAAAAYREGQRSLLREALVALAAYGAAEAEERGWLGEGGAGHGGAPQPSREAWVRLSREAWAEAPPAQPQYDPADYADGDAADHAQLGYSTYATAGHAADRLGYSSTYDDDDDDDDDDDGAEETGYLAALHELRERAKASGSMHVVS